MSPNRRALGSVLVAALLGWMSPLPAMAQGGVLYEVTENMKVRDGKVARRMATAALAGKIDGGTPWCPAALGAAQCDVTATGSDSVDLSTGRGPVNASFAVVVQGDNNVDGPEWVVLRGTLAGTIDLSPAVLGYDGVPGTKDEMPYGTLTGSWIVRGVKNGPMAGYFAAGKLRGVFRLPFTYGESPALYMMDDGSMALVADNERSLGVPTVRLDITFLP
jgi:hypothetical protein